MTCRSSSVAKRSSSSVAKRSSSSVAKQSSLAGVRRTSVEIYELSQAISRVHTIGLSDEFEKAEVLERMMGQAMLVNVVGDCEYDGRAGWVPNHGIVKILPSEIYEVKLKGSHEKVEILGSNLQWAVDKYHLLPIIEDAARAVLAAAEEVEFSDRQMRYAHQFIDVLLPLWISMKESEGSEK